MAANSGWMGEARDQLGHWSLPQQRGKPCPHACCQGRHPHPKNTPVKLSRAYLRSLSEDEVYRELQRYQRYSDTHTEGYLQVIAEATRREDAAEKARQGRARSKAAAASRAAEWRDEQYRQWILAENATKGYYLSPAGKRAGISERDIVTTADEAKFQKYASDELKDYYWGKRRVTYASWRRGQAASRREARGAAHDQWAQRAWR